LKKVISLIFFISVTSASQWVQVNSGMGNNTVLSLTANANYLFAGTNSNGIYITSNNGSNWVHSPLNSQSIYALTSNSSSIYAGVISASSGVYLSTNNGLNWSQSSLNYAAVWSLAASGNNVFAGTVGYGVFFSSNSGANWIQTALGNNRFVRSLAINGNSIFAGTGSDGPDSNNRGIFLSTNNGQSWSNVAPNIMNVRSLAAFGNFVYAGTQINGVYISTNNGMNWSQTSLNNLGVLSLALNGNSVIAGTSSTGVYISSNNGTNWYMKNEGFPGGSQVISSLCISDNYIFAGMFNWAVWRRPLGELTGIVMVSHEIPDAFRLEQNYPNPFNPATTFKFSVPVKSQVSLKIYNSLGTEIETLVNHELSTSVYEATWNASKYSSGVYFYRFTTESFTQTRKMILIK
jgi:hypothetical protein